MSLRLTWVRGYINSDPGVSGVYILYYYPRYSVLPGGRRVIYVGQGNVGQRFAAHARDPRIKRYGFEDIYTVWARVSSASQKPVEKYLHFMLNPIVSTSNHATMTAVNLPWGEV